MHKVLVRSGCGSKRERFSSLLAAKDKAGEPLVMVDLIMALLQ